MAHTGRLRFARLIHRLDFCGRQRRGEDGEFVHSTIEIANGKMSIRPFGRRPVSDRSATKPRCLYQLMVGDLIRVQRFAIQVVRDPLGGDVIGRCQVQPLTTE